MHRLYPHTETQDVVHSTGRLLFRTLRITPEDIQAQRNSGATAAGLVATYIREGDTYLQRMEPQLNSFALETLYLVGQRLPVQMPFVASWSGKLRIPATGRYTFEVIGSGPYSVDLSGELLCLEELVKPDELKTCTATRQLEAGIHPLRARWDTSDAKATPRRIFQMFWIPPAGQRTLIPPDSFVSPE